MNDLVIRTYTIPQPGCSTLTLPRWAHLLTIVEQPGSMPMLAAVVWADGEPDLVEHRFMVVPLDTPFPKWIDGEHEFFSFRLIGSFPLNGQLWFLFDAGEVV